MRTAETFAVLVVFAELHGINLWLIWGGQITDSGE